MPVHVVVDQHATVHTKVTLLINRFNINVDRPEEATVLYPNQRELKPQEVNDFFITEPD